MHKEVLLAYFPKLTYQRYCSLIEHFGSVEAAWHANDGELKRALVTWREPCLNEFLVWKHSLDEQKIAAELATCGINTLPISDPAYPPLLRQLYDPPICLFVRGSLAKYTAPLAVVGPRKYSSYGKYIAETFVPTLARSGVTIVSGLAMGIDALAHRATLNVGGITIAVLGGGVDVDTLHPRLHTRLAEDIIAQGGAIISECPPKIAPTAFSFPKRNRIIAGLSLGTFVIEAAKKSGALITGQCSIDIGRDIFAPPQNITSSTGVGTNRLLQQGAHLVISPEEILSILHITPRQSEAPSLHTSSPEERRVLQYLSRDPMHIDILTKKTGLPSAALTGTLTLLELRGRVKNLGNMTYILMV